MRSVLVLALSLIASQAHAQAPGMTLPIAPAPPQQPVDQKSPSIAVLLSVGVPIAGVVTLVASDDDSMKTVGLVTMYLGPSTGQWYAGKFGGLGLGLRALAAVSMYYGFVKVLDGEEDCDEFNDACGAARDRAQTSERIGSALVLTGIAVWAGSSIYDVALAKRAADSWNAQHHVTLTPGLVGMTGKKTPGLFVSARF